MRIAIGLVLVATVALADSKVPVDSIWVGTYTCAQGVTDVRLTIATTAGGAATAHFSFGPNQTNRSIPRGDYWLKGSLRADDDGRLALALRPDHWGVHPGNYVMVGLTARSGRDQRSLVGTIDNPSCSTISVDRVIAEAD